MSIQHIAYSYYSTESILVNTKFNFFKLI